MTYATIAKVIHRGTGSDLMALCGLVEGISGSDQVQLSYCDDQVTCVKCLQLRIKELSDHNPSHRPRAIETEWR